MRRSSLPRCLLIALLTIGFHSFHVASADDAKADVNRVTGRGPESDAELAYWLKNSLYDHRFSMAETALSLGLTETEIRDSLRRLKIEPNPAANPGSDVIRILPYPGGRHPRIGFLDGAIDPQRETKVTVFTPWQPAGSDRADFVVVDVPEAIWSNLGLTYLAHSHVPTIWAKAGIELEQLEWERREDGSLFHRRKLPNGIEYTSTVVPRNDHVSMTMTLTNGTDAMLTDLRVQNCVMLKGADGFTSQTNDNKVFQAPYVAVHDDSGGRWIVTAWLPNHRAWGNAPCPCLHSDPKFPDCGPGETKTIHGRLSFFEGKDIQAELKRIDALEWWAE